MQSGAIAQKLRKTTGMGDRADEDYYRACIGDMHCKSRLRPVLLQHWATN